MYEDAGINVRSAETNSMNRSFYVHPEKGLFDSEEKVSVESYFESTRSRANAMEEPYECRGSPPRSAETILSFNGKLV